MLGPKGYLVHMVLFKHFRIHIVWEELILIVKSAQYIVLAESPRVDFV